MNRLLTTAALAALLSGCAAFGAIEQAAVGTAAAAADEARARAEFVLCRGITIGAWVRAYGQDAVRAQAWRTLCSTPVNQMPTQ